MVGRIDGTILSYHIVGKNHSPVGARRLSSSNQLSTMINCVGAEQVVRTTMVYTHVLNEGLKGVRSPVDTL